MKETLCWSCTRPGTNYCSWDREFIPVKGWVAVPTQTDGFDTFRVLHCPEFCKEPPRQKSVALEVMRKTRNDDGTEKSCVVLTDEILMDYDRQGLSLEEISARTGVRTGVIYQRRQKLRRDICGED